MFGSRFTQLGCVLVVFGCVAEDHKAPRPRVRLDEVRPRPHGHDLGPRGRLVCSFYFLVDIGYFGCGLVVTEWRNKEVEAVWSRQWYSALVDGVRIVGCRSRTQWL